MESAPLSPEAKRLAIAALRGRVAVMERRAPDLLQGGPLPIPICPPIDEHLQTGGLLRGVVHEFTATEDSRAAATSLCAILLGRAGGQVMRISRSHDVWPPGLAQFGLLPDHLLFARPRNPQDALWAAEESLRCRDLAGVVLEIGEVDMTASRRLQLGAEAGGLLALLLMPVAKASSPSASHSRWEIRPLPTPENSRRYDVPRPQWAVKLLRGRGAVSRQWGVVWDEKMQALGSAFGSAEAL